MMVSNNHNNNNEEDKTKIKKKKFLSLRGLPTMIFFELPFLVNKKPFQQQIQQQQKFSPIIDGFLGGARNIYVHTLGATPTNLDPTTLHPSYPSLKRTLDFPTSISPTTSSSTSNKKTVMNNNVAPTMNDNNASYNFSSHHRHQQQQNLFGSTSFFNNNKNGKNNTGAKKQPGYIDQGVSAIFSSRTASATAYTDPAFHSSFNTPLAPIVDGRCVPCSDILVKVTYTKKTVVKQIVTTTTTTTRRVLRVKKNNNKKNKKQEQSNSNNEDAADNKKTTTKTTTKQRIVNEVSTHNFEAKPVAMVKFAVEFKSPADFVFRLHRSVSSTSTNNNDEASLMMMFSSNNQQNKNNNNLLPVPQIISTKPDLVHSKVIPQNRCDSPIGLGALLKEEGKIAGGMKKQNSDDGSSEGTTNPQLLFLGDNKPRTLTLSGDLKIAPQVPNKMRKELFMYLSLARYGVEMYAIKRLFEVEKPNVMLFQVDDLCQLVMQAWNNIQKEELSISSSGKGSKKKTNNNNKNSSSTTTTPSKIIKKEEGGVGEDDDANENTNSNSNNNLMKLEHSANATRAKINFAHKPSMDNVKTVARSCTYTFTSGPFRLYRIRYGYDPRKQPKDVHKFDQLLTWKVSERGKRLIDDLLKLAKTTFNNNQNTDNNRNFKLAASKINIHPVDFGLKNVLIKIRQEYEQSLSKSANNNNNKLFMTRQDSLLPQHDFFSRLLLSHKLYTILCVGDYWKIPIYREILEAGETDTFDSTHGFFTKAAIMKTFEQCSEHFCAWITDTVAPNISEDAKAVDYYSLASSQENQKNAPSSSELLMSMMNRNNNQKSGGGGGESNDFFFGEFYNSTSNVISTQNRASAMDSFFDEYEDDDDEPDPRNNNNDDDDDDYDNNNNNNNMMMMMPKRRKRNQDNNHSDEDDFFDTEDDNSNSTNGSFRQNKTVTNRRRGKKFEGKNKPSMGDDDEDDIDVVLSQAFGMEQKELLEGGYREKSSEFQL